MKLDLGDGRIIDVEKQLHALRKVEYEDSLYLFLRDAWRVIDSSPWVDTWALEAVAEHLQAVIDGDIQRLLINIPPRFGKSTITGVCLPAWTWAQPRNSPTSGPGVQFLCASYGNPLALRDSVKCRSLIESPWYQQFWSDRFSLATDQNTKSRFKNDKGGERLITSVDAGVTGEGGAIIIIDDPNAANEAFSEATIQSTIDWWDRTMSTRLNDQKTGAYIVIQQRLAEDDLSGHILENEPEDWVHLCLPMRMELDRRVYTVLGVDEHGKNITWTDPRVKEGELLAPNRFGDKEVKALERRLGPWGASGQLQQRPEPAGGGIIKREWWTLWDDPNFPLIDYILASLDTAFTEDEMNDPSAMTIWGVFSEHAQAQTSRVLAPDGRVAYDERLYLDGAPKVMLMYAWTERLEFNALVTKSAQVCRKLKVDKLLIENKASGISVSQEIRRLYNRERWSVQLNDPKSMDKVSRLYSIQHIFSEGMVYAPDRTWAEKVITQVGQFPKGKHDDLVDTTSQALRHLRDIGLLTRSEERMGEIEDGKTYPNDSNKALYPV